MALEVNVLPMMKNTKLKQRVSASFDIDKFLYEIILSMEDPSH